MGSIKIQVIKKNEQYRLKISVVERTVINRKLVKDGEFLKPIQIMDASKMPQSLDPFRICETE